MTTVVDISRDLLEVGAEVKHFEFGGMMSSPSIYRSRVVIFDSNIKK